MGYTLDDFARDHNITPEENMRTVARLRQSLHSDKPAQPHMDNEAAQPPSSHAPGSPPIQ